MSLIRHDGNDSPRVIDPFDRSIFEWPFSGFGGLRRLFDLEEDLIKVEEYKENNELVIRAELPGVDPDRDVDISMVDGSLQIRAERRQEQTREGRNLHRSELRYGSFSRVIPLPPGAKESDVKASYKDGLLEVRVPVEERSKSSKIPIEHQ